MLATPQNIINYIPQRHPFVMVHNLIDASPNSATTQLKIEADNLLVENGFFSEGGMVENIAQTVAVQAGYCSHIQNKPAPLGFIANVKDLKVFGLAPVGSTFTTSVRVANQVFDMTLCEGEVRQNGKILCQCEIRVFVKSTL